MGDVKVPTFEEVINEGGNLGAAAGLDPIGKWVNRQLGIGPSSNGTTLNDLTQQVHADEGKNDPTNDPPKPEDARMTAFAKLTRNLRSQRRQSTLFAGAGLLSDPRTSAPVLVGN